MVLKDTELPALAASYFLPFSHPISHLHPSSLRTLNDTISLPLLTRIEDQSAYVILRSRDCVRSSGGHIVDCSSSVLVELMVNVQRRSEMRRRFSPL